MNALLQAGKQARGCTLYLAGFDVETEEADPDLAVLFMLKDDRKQRDYQCDHADSAK